MALNFQDQGTVDLGRSRVQTPDPYQPIRHVANDGGQMEALAQSLNKLAGVSRQNDEKNIEAEKKNINVYSQALAEGIKEGPVTDQAVNDILNKQHIVVRAAAAEDLGLRRGVAAAENAFAKFPEVSTPEDAQKAYDNIMVQARKESEGNISYQQGYLRAFEQHYLRRTQQDGAERIKSYREEGINAFGTRTRNIIKDVYDGVGPYKDTGVDPNVVNTPATKRLSELDPKLYDTPYKLATQLVGAEEHVDNAAIASFIKRTTGKTIDPAQTPWCAAFVEGVLASKGIKGTGSLWARSYMNFGTGTDNPKQGDIVVLQRGNDAQTGHVGFFAGYDDNGNVKVLGGNQSDSVSVTTFPKSHVVGFRTADQGDVKDFVQSNPQQYASLNTGTATDATSGSSDPAVPQGTQVASNTSTPAPTAYDGSPLTTKLMRIQQEAMRLDAVYKQTRLASNAERRDRFAEELRLEALERDDPTLLRAFPKEIMTDDVRRKYIATEKEIQRNIEHKQAQAWTQAEHREKKAKEDAQTAIMQQFANGERINESKAATITYLDHNGQQRTVSDHTLFAMARGMNLSDRNDPLDSKGVAANLSDTFRSAYLSGDLTKAFANDPQMMAILGDRKMISDSEARAYIANRSDLNRTEKMELWTKLDEWKNNYTVIKDQVVQDFYKHYVGNTVDKYTKADKVALKMASVDINVRNALASVEGDVRQAFEDTVLNDINGFKADNKRDPTYAEKKKIMEDAAKKAREVFDDRVKIIEGISGSEQPQQNNSQQTSKQTDQPKVQMPTVGSNFTGTFNGTNISGQVISTSRNGVVVKTADGKLNVLDAKDISNGSTIVPPQDYDTRTSQQIRDQANQNQAAASKEHALAINAALEAARKDPFVQTMEAQIREALKANNGVLANTLRNTVNTYLDEVTKKHK